MNADFDIQKIRRNRVNRLSRIATSRSGRMTGHRRVAGAGFGTGTATGSDGGFPAGFEAAGVRPGFTGDRAAHRTDDIAAEVESDDEAVNRRRAVRSALIVSALGALAVAAAFMSPPAASGAAPAPALASTAR